MKELSEQIAEMDKELKNYKKESQDLQLDVAELNLKYNGNYIYIYIHICY